MKRIRSRLMLVVLLGATGGCTSWQRAELEPQVLLQPGHEGYTDQVMLTLRDGSKVVLSQPELIDDTVHGTVGNSQSPNRQPRAVPMDSIRVIEVQRATDGGWGLRIALLVFAGALLLAVIEALPGG